MRRMEVGETLEKCLAIESLVAEKGRLPEEKVTLAV